LIGLMGVAFLVATRLRESELLTPSH
jgi:hypothetical protein